MIPWVLPDGETQGIFFGEVYKRACVVGNAAMLAALQGPAGILAFTGSRTVVAICSWVSRLTEDDFLLGVVLYLLMHRNHVCVGVERRTQYVVFVVERRCVGELRG